MDPITLIVTALAMGASAAAREAASDAVKSAYEGLKGLIQRHFKGNDAGAMALEKHTEANAREIDAPSKVWEPALREELTNSGAADDAELIKAAQALLAAVDPKGTKEGIYLVGPHVEVRGIGNTMQAEGDIGTMNVQIGGR